MSTRGPVVLLGTQRFEPTLGEVMGRLGVTGKVAVITAGWQERESEDADLDEHLGRATVNLRLHQRADQLFIEDYELRAAHHERQEEMRVRREVYRLRLSYALDAYSAVVASPAPRAIKDEQRQEALEAIQALDTAQLTHARQLRESFEAGWATRPSLVRQRAEVRELVEQCAAVAIAGGHVASLVNRLFLFGFPAAFGDRPVFAWSAGAMAVSDRVVLFHDDAPVGPAVVEVLEAGLELARELVLLPQPEQRLRLDDADRVQSLARRFEPARCVALPARSWLVLRDGALSSAHGPLALLPDGATAPLLPRVLP